MAKVDEITKRFWNKLHHNYVKYYPKRVKNVGLEGEMSAVWSILSRVGGEPRNCSARRPPSAFKNLVIRWKNSYLHAFRHHQPKKDNVQGFQRESLELTGAIDAYDHIKVSRRKISRTREPQSSVRRR